MISDAVLRIKNVLKCPNTRDIICTRSSIRSGKSIYITRESYSLHYPKRLVYLLHAFLSKHLPSILFRVIRTTEHIKDMDSHSPRVRLIFDRSSYANVTGCLSQITGK